MALNVCRCLVVYRSGSGPLIILQDLIPINYRDKALIGESGVGGAVFGDELFFQMPTLHPDIQCVYWWLLNKNLSQAGDGIYRLCHGS